MSDIYINVDYQWMILTEGLGKRFGELWAIKGINLSVCKGEIFGMVGPDGAGKTTTMRILAGILQPSEGNVWIAGREITKEAEKVKEMIAYMPQRFGLYDDLTVMENINFYADLYNVPSRERTERIDTLLSFSNLHQFRSRHAGKLSGGMKQKLGLICALIHKPEVLLLDEPTCGVDPLSRRDFWKILYGLMKEGVTIFLTTAYLDEAERCKRVALLHRGEIIAVGSPDEIKKIAQFNTLELVFAGSGSAIEGIKTLPGIIQARLTGQGIHIILDERKVPLGTFRQIMKDAGFEPVDIRTVTPGLEDAFISIVKMEEEIREVERKR